MSISISVDSARMLPFHQLFDVQVAKTPERTAILFEDECWTYQDLANFVNTISRELLKRQLAAEECVGICVDRSPRAIAAMMGIMRAGGAFVPLDPELPAERIAFMLQDAGIKQVICDEKYAELVGKFGEIAWMTLESLCEKQSNGIQGDQWELPTIHSDQLAYVMYTSGSTGKPKGVMIENRALTAYCLADIEVYHLTEWDRTLHFSTINFDIAIEEIFPPLLTGSAVVVRPRDRVNSHNELTALIEEYEVTAVHLATAYWHEWVDLMIAHSENVPTSLRLLIATGEKVSVEHFRRWNSICKHNVQWSNAYGPTEATVSSTVFTPSCDWCGDAMPIGKPLSGYEAYILDSNSKALGVGELGELVIAGPALARGYLNRPDLTAKAFVEWIDEKGQTKRVYKTGDLARWNQDGDIEFSGRIDHQIKVGSYRIEPGEIEAVINQHCDVLESLVVHEQIENQKYLIAFVATPSRSLEPADIVQFLRDRLPPYMIPVRYVLVDRFPKTLNGKIDRKALPPADAARTVSGSGENGPLDEMEARLAKIWSEVLHVSDIGRDDNFFFLGGSSLLVTRVILRIKKELNLELPVRDVFANPVLCSLARHLKLMLGEASSMDKDPQVDSRVPKIEAQFIPSKGEQLFSVFYPGRGVSKRHAVLVCGSVGHEYARSHRNLQQLAQMLSEHGFDVLRFDYSATGNSSGNCEQGTPKQWLQDIASAASWLKTRSAAEKFSVIGLRLGGLLLSNSDSIEGDNLILWDPAIRGERFLSQLAQFHRRALQDFVRYPNQRLAEPNQFFGFVTNDHAIVDLCKMKLRLNSRASFKSLKLLTTKDYWDEEWQNCDSEMGEHANHHCVNDEVLWHWPQYTESAFSSASSYRWILNQLAGGCR